jgi:hypothetical protein
MGARVRPTLPEARLRLRVTDASGVTDLESYLEYVCRNLGDEGGLERDKPELTSILENNFHDSAA